MRYWHKKRLAKLAEVLMTVPRERFCMGIWYGTRWGRYGYPQSFTPDKSPKAIDCGSAGCALGWACVVPSFYKAGLRLVKGVPMYEGLHTDDAACRFFGLTEDEERYLFSSGNHGTAQDAAHRIETVLRDHTTKGA